jgi:hypothetical protein
MLRQNVSLLEINLNMGIIDKEVERTDIKINNRKPYKHTKD